MPKKRQSTGSTDASKVQPQKQKVELNPVWDIPEVEIALFEAMDGLPPTSGNFSFSVINAHIKIKKITNFDISPDEIRTHLSRMFNIVEAVNLIETEPVAFQLPSFVELDPNTSSQQENVYDQMEDDEDEGDYQDDDDDEEEN